jgi:hypothetical protein
MTQWSNFFTALELHLNDAKAGSSEAHDKAKEMISRGKKDAYASFSDPRFIMQEIRNLEEALNARRD